MHPSNVERVIRRATRAKTRIDNTPNTAAANRHPNGSAPNNHSPTPIIHFPNGGWTTYEAHLSISVGAQCCQMLASPLSSSLSASFTATRSTPNLISESESLA